MRAEYSMSVMLTWRVRWIEVWAQGMALRAGTEGRKKDERERVLRVKIEGCSGANGHED